METSLIQRWRLKYESELPEVLDHLPKAMVVARDPIPPLGDAETVQSHFPLTFGQPVVEVVAGEAQVRQPLKVGVVFSGGQAPGGHNVICGLWDALRGLHRESEVIGFIGGPSGLVDNKSIPLSDALLASYRNQGGFDLLGSGRTKIETDAQFAAALATAQAHDLDGLLIIGGDDSNTNAAYLAEYFHAQGSDTRVIGVPKTIDGDLKNSYIEISFGHDTACKTYAEAIGNICRDALSAKKYYHFIRLMGRSASHVALECALQTHPNFTLLSEEVAMKKQTLAHIVEQIADMICVRALEGKNYGVILVPEGLIEFVPEMELLMRELNAGVTPVASQLSIAAAACFESLPHRIQEQLLLDRDPHGNIQVSKIDTEMLLIEMVSAELEQRKAAGHYTQKFAAQGHFLGYEGRSALPSNFDANYCYALGYAVAALIEAGCTGYIACIRHLAGMPSSWTAWGLPLTSLMAVEERNGKKKTVLRKALVDLKGAAFRSFAKYRTSWQTEDSYLCPGPIQFGGPPSVANLVLKTLALAS